MGTGFLRHSCINFYLSSHLLLCICMCSWQKTNQSYCRDSSCDPCLSDFCEIQDKFCFQKVVRCEIPENHTWLLGVSEFLPVISSIPCTIWAKSSVDLFIMLLSFVKIDGVNLVLYCGHKWNLAHIFCIYHPICIHCQCAKFLGNAFSVLRLLWK